MMLDAKQLQPSRFESAKSHQCFFHTAVPNAVPMMKVPNPETPPTD